MKIDSKLLKKFIKKVTLNGKIDECSLLFSSDGCKTRTINLSQTIIINGLIKPSVFIDYTALNERVTFSDVSLLISILNSFDGETDIQLNSDKDKLVFKNVRKKAEFKLLSEDINDNFENKSFHFAYEGSFNIKVEEITSLLTSVKAIQADTIKLSNINGNLTININSDSKLHNIQQDTDISYKDFEVTFSQPLIQVLEVVDNDEICVSAESNYPITLKEDDKNMIIEYTIANTV